MSNQATKQDGVEVSLLY